MRVRKLYNDGGEIASTILQQLGGANRLHAMTGAYNFVNIGNGLSFKIKNQRANYIKITLTSMDLYDVEVGRIRGNTYKVVAEGKGMYAEELKPFIEKSTGMYLSLGRGFAKGGMISVKSDDGEDLMYKIDTDEKYIEVDENTKKYLSDIALVMDRNFRKLKDTYIFWYDDMSDSDITELEEVFQTSLNMFAKGGKVKNNRVKFVDKVESIADRLDGTKVPKRLKKDYGVRYNRTEAEEAARRIAGAQLRDRKMADGGEISEDLFNYVRLYFKAKLDSDTAASNGNLAHSIRLDDKADDYRNDAMRLIDDYNKKNNTNLSIYDFNRNGILKLHIEQIEEYFDLEYIGEYGNKMRFINKNDGSILEINISSNPKDAIMRYYEENYKHGGEMADGGNVWDEDLNVYTLVSSKEYFGSDTASDKRRWFRRNGRGLTREQAKRMAQDYIDRYGKERVYIGNIRHYR